MPGARIFISYRRDDTRADSGRLYDRLSARFPGKVFRDVTSLEPGVDWREAIARSIGQSDACIVVIGEDWLKVVDARGYPRLYDPNDTLRQELATALQRSMRVFPVLVGGATMPTESQLPPDLQPLCRRQVLFLTEQSWDEDFGKLVLALEKSLSLAPHRKVPRWLIYGGGGLLALGALAQARKNGPPSPSPDPTIGPIAGGTPTTDLVRASATDLHEVLPAPTPPSRNVEPAPSTRADVPRRIDSERSARGPAGAWRVIGGPSGGTIFELFDDHSFRHVAQMQDFSIGSWRNYADEGSIRLHGTRFDNGSALTCDWHPAARDGDTFDGCVGTVSRMGEVAFYPPIPRFDARNMTKAERAYLSVHLGQTQCPCGCGMTILACLENDLTCDESPKAASQQAEAFLHWARH